MANSVVGDELFQCFFDFWAFWPGADQAHFSPDHANQLWEFIDAHSPQPVANIGDALITTVSPLRACRFGVNPHRSQFADVECLAV